MVKNGSRIFGILLIAPNAQWCAGRAVDHRWHPNLHRVHAMADKLPNSQHRYLRTPEAARMVGLSSRTLEKHRTYGTGPQYYKLGGRVVYAVEDLQAWTKTGQRQSTADHGKGVVHAAKRVPGLGPLANAPKR